MSEVPISRLAAILIILMVLGGCARSQATNYYILHSLQNQQLERRHAGTERDPVIGIGPVKIPEYLNRPQMVTRVSYSSLQFAEFARWAEPLDKNLMRVLADNLSILVPSEHVLVFPWQQSMPVQYQITIEIIHLEKAPDEKIMLDACWIILGNGGDNLMMAKRSRLTVPVESAGFEGIASAESRAVEELSREIAAAVSSLPREEGR